MPSINTEQRVLSIVIKKEWFDQIADGTKNEEYRDFTPHWQSRLLNSDDEYREFDVVEFINGYNKNAPRLVVEWKGTEVVMFDDATDNSDNPDDYQFVISLGKVLKRTNC
ncbi:ASCH domain-containing protein [Spirosoma rhododendri]|uniref:ASCH domain-containing protein n=1 Tax=Spirosoma rhododendri TaxID=2728024 RepID=A0A7L5DIC7_9BACT|nr:ASCH domain-containing protein [Spirosoma rhododendri]QJD77142.1 ASCH domain-containing protein [Spirosoma rhododendri]